MSQDVIWEHFQNEGVESFNQAAPRLEFLVRRIRPGERVLNIGVGSGALEALAARKCVEINALDPSARAIAKLQESLALGDRAKVGYGQAIPFESDQFDAVIMSEVLEHLDQAIRDGTLDEVYRVLKPNGRLLGTVPARENLSQAEVVCPHCERHFHRWGHQATYDVNSLHALLSQKFEVGIVEEHFFNEWDSARWSRRLTGLLKKFLSWRGLGTYGQARNIFFVARKPAEGEVS
jgi:ubiquinone/menaquinone biosynthesis C-methylase UbiE